MHSEGTVTHSHHCRLTLQTSTDSLHLTCSILSNCCQAMKECHCWKCPATKTIFLFTSLLAIQAGLSEEMFAHQYVRKWSVQLLCSTNKLIHTVNRINPFQFTLIMITTKGRGYIRASVSGFHFRCSSVRTLSWFDLLLMCVFNV